VPCVNEMTGNAYLAASSASESLSRWTIAGTT
jgi:hypothetical protein